MEELAKQITITISRITEVVAALIIGVAAAGLMANYFRQLQKKSTIISKETIRIRFGSSVAVALELLLGADVLATAVAPSWDDIGKLAAIAILRTGLNFFLEKELRMLPSPPDHASPDGQADPINSLHPVN